MPDGVVGLDLSLTASGFATETRRGTLRSKHRGVERLVDLRRQLIDTLDGGLDGPPRLVVLEGYSMGTQRQASHAHALGELGGVIRVALWERNIAFVEVPPASLKLAATGRGNARKEEVLAAAIRRLGYEGADNNEADALWLRTMALVRFGLPGAPVLPAAHLRNWPDAIAWPDLAWEAA